MFRWVSIAVLFFGFLASIQSQNADCSSMIELKEKVYNSGPIIGFGDVREFEGYEKNNTKFFEQEENSAWYLITVPDSGIFTFDIKTHNEQDDWDFMLFEHKKMFCKRIADKKIMPIRANLSRSSFTGLKEGAKHEFIGAGINDNYSKPVIANKGDQFVLVVNNPKQSGKKHTIVLHFPESKKTEIVEEQNIEVINPKVIPYRLQVKDIDTKQLVKSNLVITGLKKKSIVLDNVAEYEVEITRKNHDVDISASAKGYMLTSKQFRINKTKGRYETILYLEKIKVGQKVNLKNIQFEGDKPTFLNTAEAPLKALLKFMEVNPTVKIEIEGHVNGPNKKNTKDYKQLSYSRSYAVKYYLIQNNIDENRIDFTGYGNSKMLYPDPKSEYQESANRRVEIKIISNDTNSGNRNLD